MNEVQKQAHHIEVLERALEVQKQQLEVLAESVERASTQANQARALRRASYNLESQ